MKNLWLLSAQGQIIAWQNDLWFSICQHEAIEISRLFVDEHMELFYMQTSIDVFWTKAVQ